MYFILCTHHHYNIHSFPTRRSSDLQFRGNVESFRLAVNQHGDLILRVQAFAVGAMTVGLAAGASAFDKRDRKSTRLNSSHTVISYAVFCLKKKKKKIEK